MKISIEHYDKKYSVEMPEDIGVEDFMSEIKGLTIFVYGEQSKDYFL